MKNILIFFIISILLFTQFGCATIYGGQVSDCQRHRPVKGQPHREIRSVALVGDIILGFLVWQIPIVVDFLDGAIYKSCGNIVSIQNVSPQTNYKTDTSITQQNVENKIDLTIVKKRIENKNYKWGDNNKYYYGYSMNGERISNYAINMRLLIFESSSLEYKKSKRNSLGKIISFSLAPIGALSIFEILLTHPIGIIGFNKLESQILFSSIAFIGINLSLGAIMATRQKYHYEKAIHLYNEEITKRQK